MTISRILRSFGKLTASLGSNVMAWRLAGLPGVSLGGSVSIAAGVRVSVADGGRLFVEDNASFAQGAMIFAAPGELRIGGATHVGIGAVIVARERITIGNQCLIAEYVTIRDQDHAYGLDGPTADNGFETAPISIGNNVWIGAKATITKGVSIGHNAVIGANAVVTHDIAANSVAVGIPARVIKVIVASH